MPRNGNGVFNLAQPPFQAQTPISSGAVNSDLGDIADGLTASLPRDGQAGMTAILPLASPGFNYVADPNTGMKRSAADEQTIFNGGVDVVKFTTTGMDVIGNLLNNGLPLLQVGIMWIWTGIIAPPGFLFPTGQTLLRADYPKLWAYAQIQISAGNPFYNNGNGTTTFGIGDMRGRVVANIDGGTGRLAGYNIGVAGGVSDVALSAAQLAPHQHGGTTDGMNANNPHAHSTNAQVQQGGMSGGGGAQQGVSPGGATIFGVDINHGHNFVTNTGFGVAGSAHTNTQPTIALNFILYAAA